MLSFFSAKDNVQLIKNGTKLSEIPPEERTYKVCLEAIKHDETALCVVPPEIKTEDFCLKAIKYHSFSVFCIGRASDAEFIYAVKHTIPSRLEEMISVLSRSELLSFDLSLEALKQNINLIKYVDYDDPKFINMVSKYVINSKKPPDLFKGLTEQTYLKHQNFFDTVMTRDSFDKVVSKFTVGDRIHNTLYNPNTLQGLPEVALKHIKSYLGGKTRKRKLSKKSKR